MSIKGADDRTAVAQPPTGSNAAVVAVDTPNTAGTNPGYSSFENLAGSGFAIGSNFALTANHVMNGNNTARVTMGANVPALPARGLDGNQFVPPAAQLNLSAVTTFGVDMALLQTSADITTDGAVLGMAVFYDHRDLKGMQMVTAGYPIQGNPTPDPTGRTMYTSTDVIKATSNTTIQYNADTQGGQSGSGVWLDSSKYTGFLKTDGAGDLLAGIHTNASNTAQRISAEVYKTIGDTMEAAAGANALTEAAALPVNYLIGGGIAGIGPVQAFVPEDNFIDGTYRREHIFGLSGNDRIEAGGADDEIDGGFGVDQALYEGKITDYKITITDATDPDNPQVKIEHTAGTKREGTDTLKNVEFAVFEFLDTQKFGAAGYGVDDNNSVMYVPLLADKDDPTKLRDGPEINVGQDVKDQMGDSIGSMSLEIPAFMFDGDVKYTLTIGAEENFLYNFTYIVDVSGSMIGTNIAETKAAYQALTNSLIAQGVADRSQFSVVDFNSSARLTSGLDAQGAIAKVNSLSAGGGTSFGPALLRGEEWFESLANVSNATNIAYFLSDGQGSGASANLQLVAEGTPNEAMVDVRAFGIGSGANLASLNAIDSNSAVLLSNPADLTDAFSVSGFDKTKIDRIDVKLDGNVVGTIAPSQLVDTQLGLKFEGSINGLEVTISADNRVQFDLVFNDGTPTATIETKITTGQSDLVNKSKNGTVDVVSMSVNATDYIIQGTKEIVTGNDLDNTITVNAGTQTVNGEGGDDTFIINGGTSVFDGGEGTDTAVYAVTRDAAGGVTKSGNIVTVGTGDTLLNVEYIQFSDVRVDAATLTVVPVAALDAASVTISEAEAGTKMATFTVTLSSPAEADITLDFATRDGTATAGADYTASTGSVTFAVGESSKQVSVAILDDTLIEGSEGLFVDLTIGAGATFANNAQTTSVAVDIADNDATIDISLVGDSASFSEGNGGGTNTYSVILRRQGDTSAEDVVAWSVAKGSAAPNDFIGGLPSGSVTFAAGQTEAKIDIPVQADDNPESNETFTLNLKSTSGNAAVSTASQLFTILNDDLPVVNITGTPDSDLLFGGPGDQTIDGGDRLDTAIFSGNRADYMLSRNSDNSVIITGPDGTDQLTSIERLQFDDKTVNLPFGPSQNVDPKTADPDDFMPAIRDFDGRDLFSGLDWKRIGETDTEGDGDTEVLFVNPVLGRWASVGIAEDGNIYMENNGWGGDTRVVGIYEDPLIALGIVVPGSDHDSQTRFTRDLGLDNIGKILGAGDYDRDGLQEIYFKIADGTAYLHAYMHADGNIQYANYQVQSQVEQYMMDNGVDASVYSGWFV